MKYWNQMKAIVVGSVELETWVEWEREEKKRKNEKCRFDVRRTWGKEKKNYEHEKKVQDVGRCQMKKKAELENSDTVESIRVQKAIFQCSSSRRFLSDPVKH